MGSSSDSPSELLPKSPPPPDPSCLDGTRVSGYCVPQRSINMASKNGAVGHSDSRPELGGCRLREFMNVWRFGVCRFKVGYASQGTGLLKVQHTEASRSLVVYTLHVPLYIYVHIYIYIYIWLPCSVMKVQGWVELLGYGVSRLWDLWCKMAS